MESWGRAGGFSVLHCLSPVCLMLHRKRQLRMKSAPALLEVLGEFVLKFQILMNGISQHGPSGVVSELHIHQRCYVTITTTTT